MCTYLKYIDFVVWTKKGLFIERIFPHKSKRIFCARNFTRAYWQMVFATSDICKRCIQLVIVKNFVTVSEGNMGKWLGVMMKNASISGFTWNV